MLLRAVSVGVLVRNFACLTSVLLFSHVSEWMIWRLQSEIRYTTWLFTCHTCVACYRYFLPCFGFVVPHSWMTWGIVFLVIMFFVHRAFLLLYSYTVSTNVLCLFILVGIIVFLGLPYEGVPVIMIAEWYTKLERCVCVVCACVRVYRYW